MDVVFSSTGDVSQVQGFKLLRIMAKICSVDGTTRSTRERTCWTSAAHRRFLVPQPPEQRLELADRVSKRIHQVIMKGRFKQSRTLHLPKA